MYYEEDEECFEDWLDRCVRFADPYGNSALYRASKDNPRDRPCPTCGTKNVLTRRDVAAGYQCDRCADIAEGKYPPC